jgi:hypothetical protein
MKKLLLLFAVVLVFVGCDLEDDNPRFHVELLPVESATFPAEFHEGQVYEIPIKYIRPSTCHVFEGFFYGKDENIRTIAIQTTVLEQDNCTTPSTNPMTEVLKFIATTESSYIFKLWKGKNASGEDIFEEIEVPVVP